MNKKIPPILILVFLASSVFGFAQNADGGKKGPKPPAKLTADEIIAKHLASIGTSEELAAVKTRVIIGTGTLTSKLGYSGVLNGPVQLASDDTKSLFAIIFNSNEYPYEKVAFDGKDQTFALPNGKRTAFNEFLKSKSSIVKEGLFNGVLSSNWFLLDLKSRKAKISYAGTANVGSRPTYKLKFSPRSDELSVTLYFDAETFRHVETEYQYTVEPRIGTSSTDIQGQKDYYTLTELFADFNKAGDLILPFTYQITVDVQRSRTTSVENGQLPIGTGSLTYTIKLAQVYYNQPLEPGVFKVS